MEKISVQLKRLQRHYDYSVKTYDDASMLDLVHTLRIWTELKTYLSNNCESFKKTGFVTGSPIRKTLKHIKNSQYVLAYLPKDGVTTFASQGHLASTSNFDKNNNFSLAVKVKNTGSSILLSQYCFVSKSLQQEYVVAIGKEKISKCNYANWMSSETVRMQFKNELGKLEKFSISREMLIKRVANIFDASHTSLNNEGGNNKFDEPINWLMNFQCGGLPLPYFLLLKIAQDIIYHVPNLLEEERNK